MSTWGLAVFMYVVARDIHMILSRCRGPVAAEVLTGTQIITYCFVAGILCTQSWL